MRTKNNSTVINPNQMNIVERVKAPTPKFFKTLQTIGIALAAVGGALLTAPIALPAAVISVAGYIVLAGGIMSAVSQTAVDNTTDTKTIENEVP